MLSDGLDGQIAPLLIPGKFALARPFRASGGSAWVVPYQVQNQVRRNTMSFLAGAVAPAIGVP